MSMAKRRKVEHRPSQGPEVESESSFESFDQSQSVYSNSDNDAFENASEASVSEEETAKGEKASSPIAQDTTAPQSNGTSLAEKHTSTTESHDEDQRNQKDASHATKSSISAESKPDKATAKSFEELGIIQPLCEACRTLNFKTPTPIQSESIPYALQGRDIIGLAETGSGKTAAFALPILQALMEKPQPKFALVLAPTRELAIQTSQQFLALGAGIAVRTAVIVGGMGEVDQAIALAKEPHIVVATPGRLLYHLENTKGFHLKKLKYLVMDEADRLLDMNFGKEIDRILHELPRETRRTHLFSATMSSGVASLQRASLRSPVRVSISNDASSSSTPGFARPKHSTVKNLVQRYLFRPHKTKDLYLLYLLVAPFAGHSTIVFARTVRETARLTELLRTLGLGAIPLHGDLSQSARLAALGKFKAHKRDILVATDVAARGLDIPNVDLVLNYDLPGDDTTYVHRVGRTARAGNSGYAVSFVSQYDVEVWLRIEKALGTKVQELGGVEEGEVKVLTERVGEAQREAVRKMRDAEAKRGKGGRGKRKGRRGFDEKDADEG